MQNRSRFIRAEGCALLFFTSTCSTCRRFLNSICGLTVTRVRFLVRYIFYKKGVHRTKTIEDGEEPQVLLNPYSPARQVKHQDDARRHRAHAPLRSDGGVGLCDLGDRSCSVDYGSRQPSFSRIQRDVILLQGVPRSG